MSHDTPSMSKYASPADYWKARAENAEAALEQVTAQRDAAEAAARSETKATCKPELVTSPGVGEMKWCEQHGYYFGKDQECPASAPSATDTTLLSEIDEKLDELGAPTAIQNGDGLRLSRVGRISAVAARSSSAMGAPGAARLIEALLAYEQADETGVFVKVSRQACDEAAELLAKLCTTSASTDGESHG